MAKSHEKKNDPANNKEIAQRAGIAAPVVDSSQITISIVGVIDCSLLGMICYLPDTDKKKSGSKIEEGLIPRYRTGLDDP